MEEGGNRHGGCSARARYSQCWTCGALAPGRTWGVPVCVTVVGPVEVQGMVSTSDTGAVFYAATQWMPFAKFADVVAVLTLLDANGDATPDFTVTLAYQFATTRTSSPVLSGRSVVKR